MGPHTIDYQLWNPGAQTPSGKRNDNNNGKTKQFTFCP